jgi:3-oxoacyl-(acyl-carrier-protein) synthase
MERYVVTGIGAYNGLGSSAEQSWTNLLAGKSAVTRLSWPEDDFRSVTQSLKLQ